MKIRQDAWHFKYIARHWDNRPKSLCWYFWKVVISIISAAVVGAVGTFVAFAVLTILAVPVSGWFIEVPLEIAILSALFWLVPYFAIQRGYREYLRSEEKIPPRTLRARPDKEPGLIASYLSAAHRKVCPLLEYERHW